jgi:hypothetical protein
VPAIYATERPGVRATTVLDTREGPSYGEDMSDIPSDDAPDPAQAPDKDESTTGLLADAFSPVIAPEYTDEERLKEPEKSQPADEREGPK